MKRTFKTLVYSLLVFAAWSLLVYGALGHVSAQGGGGEGMGIEGHTCPQAPQGCVNGTCAEVCLSTGCSWVCPRATITNGSSCPNAGC